MIATTQSPSQKIVAESNPAPPSAHRADVITDPVELLQILELDAAFLPGARRAAMAFPLRVPRSFVARMRRGDPADPLLRQVLPLAKEDAPTAGFSDDPVGDLRSRRIPGVLHKYRGRALLIATGACVVHCRYCFRRHFPYSAETASTDDWRAALEYLRGDRSITEVILSGGDPLSLSVRRLETLSHALAEIPHIKRLRLHTRTAVVQPESVDAAFCGWLVGVRQQKVVILHINHPNEIDESVREMCARLRAAGAQMLNQSVLLAGVNDDVETLSQLSESLFGSGVLPYYLNLLDHVQGAAHFEVSAARGRELMRALTARLPGYLVPKLVREESGAEAKTSVSLLP